MKKERQKERKKRKTKENKTKEKKRKEKKRKEKKRKEINKSNSKERLFQLQTDLSTDASVGQWKRHEGQLLLNEEPLKQRFSNKL